MSCAMPQNGDKMAVKHFSIIATLVLCLVSTKCSSRDLLIGVLKIYSFDKNVIA